MTQPLLKKYHCYHLHRVVDANEALEAHEIEAITTKSRRSHSNQDILQTHLKEACFKRGIEQEER